MAMITHNPNPLQFVADLLSAAVGNDIHEAALVGFRKSHPAEIANTGNLHITSTFDQLGACNLSDEFLEEACNTTKGIAHFYFSGLLFAHTEFKPEVKRLCEGSCNGALASREARETIFGLLDSICRQRFSELYSKPHAPHLAFDFAVLETAICLMTHTHPAEGKRWLMRMNIA